MKIKYIIVNQPIGSFYLCSIEASILAKITETKARGEHPDAIQREMSKTRAKEISEYCSDTDATFPTPIIIAIDPSANVKIDDTYIHFDENSIIGEVIDGQHRLAGLKESKHIHDFQLPVVFMFNLEPSQKAYVFSIINSKQTRVNPSLIYDLFALTKTRSPYRTCHEIARTLNKDPHSPFYKRMKMLGKKEENQELASISQGTFIKYLLELISRDPDDDTRKIKRDIELSMDDRCPLRKYFIDENDSVIYKIIFNLFSAVAKVFSMEWNNPDEYILSKPIGFGAIIKVFPTIFELGNRNGDLTESFFIEQLSKVRNQFEIDKKQITSANYGSNEQARTKLSKDIIEALLK